MESHNRRRRLPPELQLQGLVQQLRVQPGLLGQLVRKRQAQGQPEMQQQLLELLVQQQELLVQLPVLEQELKMRRLR
jgi:hypothetical protein